MQRLLWRLRKQEENVGKSLSCGFQSKEQARRVSRFKHWRVAIISAGSGGQGLSSRCLVPGPGAIRAAGYQQS